MSDTQTIRHIRGDTFSYVLVIPETIADGYFDGWTVLAQVRPEPDARSKLLTTLTTSWLAPAEDTRQLQVSATPAQTEAWPRRCVFDVQFTSPGGVVLSASYVEVEVLPDVSRTPA